MDSRNDGASERVSEPIPEPPRSGDGTQAGGADLRDPSLYVNRELSMLAFQARVLEEALDPRNPLLERVKFLTIVGSNLAEFFMVRVAGLKQQVEAGVLEVVRRWHAPRPSSWRPSGRGPRADAGRPGVLPHAGAGARIRGHPPVPVLRSRPRGAGARRPHFDELHLPGAHPAGLRSGTPVPSHLEPEPQPGRARPGRSREWSTSPASRCRARSPAWCGSPPGRGGRRPPRQQFVWLEELIAANLDELFPGMRVLEAHPFRVSGTRRWRSRSWRRRICSRPSSSACGSVASARWFG